VAGTVTFRPAVTKFIVLLRVTSAGFTDDWRPYGLKVVRSIGLEKPSRPVRVIVERAEAPSATVNRDGMAKILKSGPVKSTVIVIECDTMPANAVTVR